LCSYRKCPYSPHRGVWNFLGVGILSDQNILKEMYVLKLNWITISRGIVGEGGGGGSLRKIPFRGGGMVIFWNYALYIQ